MTTDRKRCNRCELYKPLDQFGPIKSCIGGRDTVCRNCTFKQQKALREKYRAAGLCVHCGIRPLFTTTMCQECHEKALRASVASRQRLRDKVIDIYGGRCACCGETQKAFLVIDHINGGGRKHREELGGSGSATCTWLKKNNYPPGFQVLCANCNMAKGYSGICPHQLNKSQEDHQIDALSLPHQE